MKLCAAVVLALLSSFVNAGTTYGSVSEYLYVVTQGAAADYSCAVSSHYLERNTCMVIGAPQSATPWIFGLVENKVARTAFLFVLKSDATRLLHLEVQSSPFTLPRDVSVESLEFAANKSFKLQLNSGHVAAPDINFYQFRLAKGEWRLANLERTSLGSCGGETGVISRYSVDFFSGISRLTRYKPENCKPETTRMLKIKFKVFALSEFTPFDEKYEFAAHP